MGGAKQHRQIEKNGEDKIKVKKQSKVVRCADPLKRYGENNYKKQEQQDGHKDILTRPLLLIDMQNIFC